MHPYLVSNEPLSHDQIRAQLLTLRKNALIESSHFAVAAILEYPTKQGYIYVFGVNVEDRSHNRLGLHAEQCAVSNATVLLGETAKFSKIWVMGAFDFVKPDSQDQQADSQVMECGHCRQITLSRASQDATMVAVSLNGHFSEPFNYPFMLPKAFSEHDLGLGLNANSTPAQFLQAIIEENASVKPLVESKEHPDSLPANVSFYKPKSLANSMYLPHKILGLENINANIIHKYLVGMTPHILDEKHITSNIVSCVLKFDQNGKTFYVPGTLSQDVAFLTTDALYAAIGMAVTSYGGAGLRLKHIHILSHDSNKRFMTGAELDTTGNFTHKECIPVFIYDKGGLIYTHTYEDCLLQFLSKNITPSQEKMAANDMTSPPAL